MSQMEDTQRQDGDEIIVTQVDDQSSTATASASASSSSTTTTTTTRKELKPPASSVGYVEPSSLDEKRQNYLCGSKYVTLDDLELYPKYAQDNQLQQPDIKTIKDVLRRYKATEYPILSQHDANHPSIVNGYYEYNQAINDKISFYRGDVTCLEIDAVVNAANESLLGGGGIDGAIHRAAGGKLRKYNAQLNGCDTGFTKISPGFHLPAKFILNTVGPVGENPQKLTSAYTTCLELVEEYSLRTIAFCGISTGIFGYPLDKATIIAMHTIRQWLEINHDKVDRIIFITFLKKEVDMYNTVAPYFFPLSPLQ